MDAEYVRKEGRMNEALENFRWTKKPAEEVRGYERT